MKIVVSLGLAACLSFVSLITHSADFASNSGASVRRDVDLSKARTLIAAADWSGAQSELRRINAKGDADWNNLMGYTLRKSANPDWSESDRYYDAALRIDPRHRGALAYSGELALQRKDRQTALQRLATLEKVCGTEACPELDSLRKAFLQQPDDAR